MFTQIMDLVKTKGEFQELVDSLKNLEASGFTTTRQDDEAAWLGIKPEIARAIQLAWKESGKSWAEVRDELVSQLTGVETVRLTVAFEPTKEIKNKIYEWVKLWVGKGLVVEITQDKEIMGGAVVEFGGKYRDLSLKKKLEAYFENPPVGGTNL